MKKLLCTSLAVVFVAAGACTTGRAIDDRVHARGPITFVDGRDTTLDTQVKRLVDRWNNRRGIKERVTFVEQSSSSDSHRASLVAAAQDGALPGARGRCNDVMAVDAVWTAEFARADYLLPLDPTEFDMGKFLHVPVQNATVDGKLYAIPARTDAGLLFYRKDYLDEQRLSPPKTWDELIAIATKLMPIYDIDGYVGQLSRYEGLTVNALEAIWANGGDLTTDGAITINSPQAKQGVEMLARGLRDGWIPRAATGFNEERSREHFQAGKALFMRNWPYAYPKVTAPDSPVANAVGVTTLPGPSALGGWNLAISPCSQHQQTARDFIRFYTEENEQEELFANGGFAPTVRSLYTDPVLRGKFPYLEVLHNSLDRARDRVQTEQYDRVSDLMQENLHSALDRVEGVSPRLDQLAEEMRATLH
ncbi:ABC transporter substrate-binding protein [Actinokineospora globicatena]|uniref:ABC transporter substrate-binding protein n=1 Tax=Actinokineospora globicatena TaxID=103729 RepID=UPI0020A5E2B9|nr:ABC transporter substrate-binding protein [Actinokineospora globicatena]MCP2301031.1 carbohydrate ABC transporter substrate-binding protein, CUT1 family [Actinokineospora globicatena]GLW77336.1 ABC transporter substrate-binding protein [Actinokineospora globicatena]GLW84170.1 ABC transporter substrate-binding protein [Actinokineospora globicatena]